MGIDLGAVVSHFRLEALLGAGGMGEVYLAEDVHLKRKVALKFLNGAAAANPDSLRRFLREAQAASALDHPNLAGIHEIGEWQGLPFLALAYCPGETLRHRIERGPLSIADIVSIQRQVAEGLSSAHAVGIVHRDLKPANIMVGPDGLVRILDFGLAKVMVADSETASRLTREGTTVGTISYMAPEQVRGEAVDARADIWAFGVVLFEMLAGCLPFRGEHEFATWQAVLERAPAPVSSLRPDAPSTLVQIVERALEKDRAERTLTAAEAAGLIGALQASLSSQSMPVDAGAAWLSRSRTVLALSLGLVVVAAGLVGGWWYRHTAKVSWARDVALPQIARLAQRDEFLPAFELAGEAERVLSDDPLLRQYWSEISRTISIGSTPGGAEVSYRPYHHQQRPWSRLGQTPVDGARIPQGLLEWKIEKPGYHPISDVGLLPPYLVLSDQAPRVPHQYVLEPLGQQPPGMSRVSLPGPQLLAIAGLEHEAPFAIDTFWIDRLEVTNLEFKRFVDAGGYREPRYWKRPFMKGDKVVPWSDAMQAFRDRTGRPGPSGWEHGTYPEGKEQEPVDGVSWYEAAAYAEYVGKMLPTIFHWSAVADRRATSGVLLTLGRYLSEGPLPVGQSRAESRFGTYDLAGNVKEWCLNEAGAGRRYALGGGWTDPAYYFNDADGRSAWDRSPSFGFRCMKLPPGQTLPKRISDPVNFYFRDFRLERPVNDQVFRAYASLFSYDHGDLAAVVKAVDDSPRDWRHETATFNAAYGQDRVIVHLLLPKRASPPFQTLVYYPGINALHQPSSVDGLARMRDLADSVVRSGRALVMPVLKSTHERQDELRSDFPAVTTQYRDHVIMWSKDLQRTVDYLQTRADIAHDQIGYLGRSWGGAMGTIMVATEPRFKLAIFLVGGFYFQRARPEVEAINFAPRVRVPSLMLNGRYDFFFPVETSQRYMFELIGVPERHKRWAVYDTSHGLPRDETVKETLAWLDKYFGPVPLK